MIIILEGASGVGKTTLANHLSDYLGWPVYRPFRTHQGSHAPGGDDPRFHGLGLPVNTWMEDMYVADVLSVLDPPANLILDRSLPSGIAHKGPDSERDGRRVSLWAERMQKAGAILVYLAMPEHAREARGGRNGDWEPRLIEAAVEFIEDANLLRVLRLNGELDVATLIRLVQSAVVPPRVPRL